MTEVYDFGVFGSAVNDEQAFEKSGNLGVQAGLGVLPQMDILYRNNGDSPRMGLLKVQVLGSGLNDLQEEFKLALAGSQVAPIAYQLPSEGRIHSGSLERRHRY